MIACISPGSSSADHSLNTLRYADRLKEKTTKPIKYDPANFVTEEVQEEAKVEPERQPQRPVMQEPVVRNQKPSEANGNLSDRGNVGKPNKSPINQNRAADNKASAEQANQRNVPPQRAVRGK